MMGSFTRYAIAVGLMVLVMGGSALAGVAAVPEIDAGSLGTAITVLTGAALVVTNRVRRRK